MINLSLLSLSLSFLVLFHGAIAQLELQQQEFWQTLQQQQQHRLLAKTRCRIQQLEAREPSRKFKSEAGVTEYWDPNSEEFECAGIEFVRHVIEPEGLLVPYYSSVPQLAYIVQGSGVQGTIIPGCAETFESEEEEEGRSRGRSDRYQKLRRIRRGDILALQEGFTHWVYNDGDTPLISVSILDVASQANQLDLKYRRFFLAGNPGASGSKGQEKGRGGREQEGSEGRGGREQEGSEGRGGREQEESKGRGGREQEESKGRGGREQEESKGRGGREQEESRGRTRRGEEGQEKRNIFYGFEDKFLANILNIDEELARSLKAQDDSRGTIIRAERINFNLPEWGSEEQERQSEEERREKGRGGYNGIEQTICSVKIRQNIDFPTTSGVYNPRGGRITTINSQHLPILAYFQLSAERGKLYRNAVVGPHWNTNAHSAIYVTKGSARIQVVGSRGNLRFDGELNEGQLLIIPQNFVVLKQAGSEGFEWISFKTNDNAMKSQLAGRLSVIRAMPEEVLMNAYGFSREDARRLKYSRDEATVFSPSSKSGGGYA